MLDEITRKVELRHVFATEKNHTKNKYLIF